MAVYIRALDNMKNFRRVGCQLKVLLFHHFLQTVSLIPFSEFRISTPFCLLNSLCTYMVDRSPYEFPGPYLLVGSSKGTARQPMIRDTPRKRLLGLMSMKGGSLTLSLVSKGRDKCEAASNSTFLQKMPRVGTVGSIVQ